MPAAESVAATAPDVRLASQVLSLRERGDFFAKREVNIRLAQPVSGELRVDVLPQVLAANRFLARLPAVLPAGIEILLPDLRDQPVAPMIRLWS